MKLETSQSQIHTSQIIKMHEVPMRGGHSHQTNQTSESSHSSRNVVLQIQDEFVYQRSHCAKCKEETPSIKRRVDNEVTWMWCTLGGVLSLCFLPFFVDECNVVELHCSRCLELKDRQDTNCCDCRC